MNLNLFLDFKGAKMQSNPTDFSKYICIGIMQPLISFMDSIKNVFDLKPRHEKCHLSEFYNLKMSFFCIVI